MKRYIRKGISRVRAREENRLSAPLISDIKIKDQSADIKEDIAFEAIDQAKNLETVMAFMALKRQSPVLCSKVKQILQEN